MTEITQSELSGGIPYSDVQKLGQVREGDYYTAPYMSPGTVSPIHPPFIARHNCLDREEMINGMNPSTIVNLQLAGIPHAVCNAYKPYSETCHALVIRTDGMYAPAPWSYEDNVGSSVCRVGAETLRHISQHGTTKCWGYNSSPLYAYRGGYPCYASVFTSWHPQMWMLGNFPRYVDEELEFSRWRPVTEMSAVQRRSLAENNYGTRYCKVLQERIRNSHFLDQNPRWREFINEKNPPLYEPRGFIASAPGELSSLLNDPLFFSEMLKPLDTMVHQLMLDIHEGLFFLNSADRYDALRASDRGKPTPKELELILSIPQLRKMDAAAQAFANKGIDDRLLAELWTPARSLASQEGKNTDMLIQGPAYSIVFYSTAGTSRIGMVIMPGFYQGPGGVVEAMGILLNRLQIPMTDQQIRERSERLYPLAHTLQVALNT